MKKYILPGLLILAVLFFAFAIFNYAKVKDAETLSKNTADQKSNPSAQVSSKNADLASSSLYPNQNTEEAKREKPVSTPGSVSSGSGGSGGSSSGSSSSSPDNGINQTNSTVTDENKTIKLPDDINISDCGIYYEQYGICTGVCPLGRCVSEGRSCYCKG